MNTKIFLLVTLLIVIPSTASIGFNNNKTNIPTEEQSLNMKPSTDKKDNSNMPIGMDWSDLPHNDCNNHSNHHSGDDDGKTHHFHFQHAMQTRRRTIIFNTTAKLIVLLSYVSSLINMIIMYHS